MTDELSKELDAALEIANDVRMKLDMAVGQRDALRLKVAELYEERDQAYAAVAELNAALNTFVGFGDIGLAGKCIAEIRERHKAPLGAAIAMIAVDAEEGPR